MDTNLKYIKFLAKPNINKTNNNILNMIIQVAKVIGFKPQPNQ